MTLFVPRVTDLTDVRQMFLVQQFLKELQDMAFKLTLLSADGDTADGKTSYNFNAVWGSYVSNGTADTADSVTHNLGRVPVYILVGLPDKDATIYDGGVAWTSIAISLKSSAVTTVVSLVLF